MCTDLLKNIGNRLGMFLLGYSGWLNHEISLYQPEQILFASREGWFMGYCWELFNGGQSDIEHHYIHTSRRLLRLVLVNNLDDMKQLLTVPSMDCGLDFFVQERFGVDLHQDKYVSVLPRLGFETPTARINRNRDYHRLCALMPVIADDHFVYVTELKKRAWKYYNQFAIGQKRSFLVDIGYNGTFNKGLSSLFPEATILGRYIATFKGVKNPYKDKGWLYNQLDNQLKNNSLSRNVPMLEYLMMLRSGSLLDFVVDEMGVKPRVKATHELVNFRVVNMIQLYAYDYIISHHKNSVCHNLKIFRARAQGLLDFLDKPTLAELDLFSNHFLEDGFGGSDTRFLFPNVAVGKKTISAEAQLIFNSPWSGAVRTLVQQQWKWIDNISRPALLNYWLFKKNIKRKKSNQIKLI